MAFGNFTKTIAIKVELATGQLKSGLGDFRSAVAGAEGPVNKLKAGAASMGATLKGLPFGVVAAGATAAGASVFKLANSWADAAVRAGNFSDEIGVSVEEGSKFLAMADRMGVDAESMVNAIDRFNSIMVETPDVFADAGVEIARFEDGSADMIGTLANVADRMKQMGQSAEAATLANSLLGARWQQLAPILFKGGDAIRAAFDAIPDEEIFSDEDVAKGRAFNAAVVELQKAMKSLGTEAGEVVVPALTGVIERLADIVGVATDVGDALRAIPDALNEVQTGLGHPDQGGGLFDFITSGIGDIVKQAQHHGKVIGNAFFGAFEDYAATVNRRGGGGPFDSATEALNDFGEEAETVSEGVADALEDAAGGISDVLEAVAEAAEEAESKFRDMNAAWQESLGLAGEFDRLNDDFLDSLAELPEALDEATESARDEADAERNRGLAIRDVMDKGIALAQSERDRRIATLEAAGATVTAAEAARIQNEELLKVAATADGDVRDALLFHIQTLNNIPPEIATEIAAAVAAGDLAEAERLLAEATRGREVPIAPELTGETEFENQLDHLTRERQMRIRALLSGTVPLEGGSLHLTDLETGEEKGVVPDEHTLALEVDGADAIATLTASQQAIADAEAAAKEAGTTFTSALEALTPALRNLDTLFSLGALSQQEYLEHLHAHQAGYDAFSVEWVEITQRIQREEKRINDERTRDAEQAAAEQKRIQDQQVAEAERRETERQSALGREGAEVTRGIDLESDVDVESQFLARLREAAKEAKQLQAAVHLLRKDGHLPAGFLDQLAAGGPEELAIARILLGYNAHQQRFVANLLAQAAGVKAFAAGGVTSGGIVLVGEQGPELARLPGGTRITPAGETARQLAKGGDTYHVTINNHRKVDERELVSLQRRYERMNGSITLR